MRGPSEGRSTATGRAESRKIPIPKLTYREAVENVSQRVRPLSEVTLPVLEARNRVLAAPVYALWDLPTADNSAMEGYAFRFAGQQAGDCLPVIGVSTAGEPFVGPVPAGEAVKIMTGGVMPPRCDTVVSREEVEVTDGGIRLTANMEKGRHVRLRSEEIERGQVLAARGDLPGSAETACLAAAGITEVTVHRSPVVALFSTGDELVDTGSVPGPGRYFFTASGRQCSGQNLTMKAAQALLPVPAGSDAMSAGSEAEVVPLHPPLGSTGWGT